MTLQMTANNFEFVFLTIKSSKKAILMYHKALASGEKCGTIMKIIVLW